MSLDTYKWKITPSDLVGFYYIQSYDCEHRGGRYLTSNGYEDYKVEKKVLGEMSLDTYKWKITPSDLVGFYYIQSYDCKNRGERYLTSNGYEDYKVEKKVLGEMSLDTYKWMFTITNSG